MTIADIVLEARALVDATSTSLTDATLLRRINDAYEQIVLKILHADGTWQFDDSNFTTNPTAKADLTTAVHEYTFTNAVLDIEEVAILDLNGLYIKLEPIDPSELGGASFEEYFGITFNGTSYVAQAGFPHYYDKVGKTIKFDKAPTASEATLTKGLRVRFSRTADFFTSGQVSTGTKEPGFAVNHTILAYKSALPYALTYKKDRVGFISSEIIRLEKEIIEHYTLREKDNRKVMTFAQRATA